MLEAAPGYSFDDTLTGAEVRDSGDTYKAEARLHADRSTDARFADNLRRRRA